MCILITQRVDSRTSIGSACCSDCEFLSELSSTSIDRERREQLGDALFGLGLTGVGSANWGGVTDREVLSSLVVLLSEPLTTVGGRFPTRTGPQLNKSASSPIESKLLYCLV